MDRINAATCEARLYIADDYGDNEATIRCQLPSGHDGPHEERSERPGGQQVVITWDVDEARMWPNEIFGDDPISDWRERLRAL